MTWDELAPGQAWESARRLVAAHDILAFARLSGDKHPLHLDDAAARAAGFGRSIAQGALGVALGTGLVSGLELTRDSLIAMVGLRWTFRAPIHAGDTVVARVAVRARRPSAQPGRGVVTFGVALVNQHGAVVQEGELVELLRTRAAIPQGERA